MKKFNELKVGEYFVYDSIIYVKNNESLGNEVSFHDMYGEPNEEGLVGWSEEFDRDELVMPVSIRN